MEIPEEARKLIRSALFYWPGAYEFIHSQVRSEMLYRLGRPHEPGFRALKLLAKGPNPLVLDVGANIGQSIFSIKTVLPGARVVSFEANPLNVAVLQRLETRFTSVTIEGFGLGTGPAQAELYIPVYRRKPMTALASLDRGQAAGWLNPGTVHWFAPSQLRIESATTSIRALDSFGLLPDFIKIDVEGAEDAVIQGGQKTIARSRPAIMIESGVRGAGTSYLLDKLGYAVAEFDGRGFRPYRGTGTAFLLP